MKLDHATIATPHLETIRDFLCDFAGLTIGPRPPFSFEGFWLYDDDKAVIHLIRTDAHLPHEKQSSRIDHIAFRVSSEMAWDQLLQRVQTAQIKHRLTALPDHSERQLFVAPVPGVQIEFVIVNHH